MTTIYLRSIKGAPLTNTEVDLNFSNLNTDKVEISDAVPENTINKIVRRDTNGNFSAGTITASLNGIANSSLVSNNLMGGNIGSIPYQLGANSTAMLTPGASGTFLRSNGPGSAPSWVVGGLNSVNVTADILEYPLMSTTVNGLVTQFDITTTKLAFNPARGSLITDNLQLGGAIYSAEYSLNVAGAALVSGPLTATGGFIGNASTVTNGVYTNTNQTISGNKTFSGTTTFTGSIDGLALVNKLFPVGSVYITTGNTNPGTFLGGTWVHIGQGRTLIGVGTLGSDTYSPGDTGGTARVTLGINEIPTHNHGGLTGNQSADHTHTATTSSSGEHTHNVRMYSNGGGSVPNSTAVLEQPLAAGNDQAQYDLSNRALTAGGHTHSVVTGGVSANHTHTISTQGGGLAHENRMPYLAVYFWQRTA